MKLALTILLTQWCIYNTNHSISQTLPVWEIFDVSNSPIPDNTIRCLQVDRFENLWIGTDNGLAFRASDGSWQVFNESNSDLADNYVRALAVDTNNVLWLGTTLGGVQKFDGTTWTSFNTTNSDLVDNFIRTITIDHNNHKWIGTVEGLVYFDDTSWTTWQMADSPLLTNNIASIAIGLNNEKYIGTINGGLVYLDQDTNFDGVYTILNSGVPDNSALKVKVDNLGKPWFAGSSGGLFTDTGNQTWMAFNHNNSGLPTNSLTTMELDENTTFYLGTQQWGLIIRRFDQTWEYYNMGNSPLPENYILSLAKDHNDNAWIGTFSSGLVRLNEEQLTLAKQTVLTQLQAFPNPTKGESQIHFNRSLKSPKITVLSTEGKLVAEQTCTGEITAIQLPDLETGYYLLLIEESNSTSNLRILVSSGF